MKLKTNFLIFFMLLIPFFKPAYLSYNFDFLNNIYNILQIISFTLALIFYIKNNEISKLIIYILIYELAIIFATIINDSRIQESIINAIQLLSICIITDIGIKKDVKSFTNALLFLFTILISINLITIIMFPNGMYRVELTGMTNNFFLGIDNVHIRYFIPAIIVSIISCYISGKKKNILVIFTIFVTTLSVILRFSATTVMGYFIFILYLIFFKYLKKIKWLNFKSYSCLYVIVFLSIVVFRIQDMFTYLIVDILGKDLTFTGRTYVWDTTINYIGLKPVLGYGIESQQVRLEKNEVIGAINAHNVFLETVYIGGVILLTIFSYIFFSTLCKKKYENNSIYKIISFGIFVFFIMMLTEAYDMTTIFMLLFFADNIDILIKERERNLNGKNKKQCN